MTSTDRRPLTGPAGPGELLDRVVEALAGFGALDVARLRDEDGHQVAEISIGQRPAHSVRLLVSADLSTNGDTLSAAGLAAPDAAPLAAIVAERERLARDLHDEVVQEIFATALSLAALVPVAPESMRMHIEELIDRQDEIVKRLRSTVFALKGCSAGGRGARQAVERVIAEAQRALGFEPTLRIVGDLSGLDGNAVVDHLVMALRESLSNVARHAHASRVDAEIVVSPSEVRFTLADDGRGMDYAMTAPSPSVTHGGGDGLRNLEARARMFGGRCTVAKGMPRGTIVDWAVPRTAPSPSAGVGEAQRPSSASSARTSSSPT